MYYVYRISASYDGFIPRAIPTRIIEKRYLIYNWMQYIDQVEKGDTVFTFFTGRGFSAGIYLISKVIDIKRIDKKVKGKILDYNTEKPIVPSEEFNKIQHLIFSRPRGSVFVIPPLLYPFFDKILSKEIISDIEILEKIDCKHCKYSDYNDCPIFSPEYIIKWGREVKLNIKGIEKIISPFWIIPRQSWWMRLTCTQHLISRIFYAFKSGYGLYSRLFAEGIAIALKKDDHLKKLQFDFITNIPLSPDKKELGEVDRVDLICKNLGKLINTPYIKDMLTLSQPISRRQYRYYKPSSEFVKDYANFLYWNKEIPLDNKTILVIDDVVTDGKTLEAFAKKIHEKYPKARVYAATGGIMAKKHNMTSIVINKFSK